MSKKQKKPTEPMSSMSGVVIKSLGESIAVHVNMDCIEISSGLYTITFHYTAWPLVADAITKLGCQIARENIK